MAFFELIFLFSLFSAETKSLPPVMAANQVVFVENKTHSLGISVLFIPSHINQKFSTETFHFFPQLQYIATESKHGYLLFCHIIS